MSNDWMPGRRDDILHMSRTWITVLGAKATLWNVSPSEVTELTGYSTMAGTALDKVKSADRTPINTAQCTECFNLLESFMRLLKNKRFRIPPLGVPDFASLLLQEPDRTPTPIPVPTGEPIGDLSFPGPHLVQLHHIHCYTGAEPDKAWGYGIRIYWIFSGTPNDKYPYRTEAEPKKGQILPYSQFTRRHKELFDFDGESGSTVYFTLRYEKGSGEAGPFGPVFKAIVP